MYKLWELQLLEEIKLTNFGPVVQGQLKLSPINIFFGPNNSGKSMTARLLYGIIRSTPYPSRYPGIMESYADWRLTRYGQSSTRYAMNVLRMVNPDAFLVTQGRKKLIVNVATTRGKATLTQVRRKGFGAYAISLRGYSILRKESARRGAIYIPAARTGTIQSFSNTLYIRNQILGEIVRAFGGSRRVGEEWSTVEMRRFLLSLGSLPLYMEDFYELLLGFLAKGETSEVDEYMRKLHEGSIRIVKRREFPSLMFVDRSGYSCEIEGAGSGVVASFPITLGMSTVPRGGLLIIEEPEAHLEPFRQMALLEFLCREALRKKITLVLTTHSDFLARKVQGLVAKKEIKNTHVGLHYFDRTSQPFTRIRPIGISSTGDAEEPLFERAVQALVRDFSM